MLDEARIALGSDGSVIDVVNTAITNIYYMGNNNNSDRSREFMDKAIMLLDWCVAHSILIIPQTIDVLILVACKHGDDDDINNIINIMIDNKLTPTDVTFNTLLNMYANEGKLDEAVGIVNMMRTWGYHPDTITFNTLLKLYKKTNDDEKTRETLLTMDTFGIKQDDYSKSTLIQHYDNQMKDDAIIDMVNNESDESITPYIIANAIVASKSWQFSLKLLQRAINICKADAAVYTSAAKSCVQAGEINAGFRVMDMMLANGIDMSRKSLSFVISTCMNPELDTDTCTKKVQKYVDIASSNYPDLITDAVCQKLIKDLSVRGLSSLACSLHIGPLAHTTCKSEALSAMFTDMQNSCAEYENIDFRQSLARRSLALLGIYCNSNDVAIRQLLRTGHFNSVLRMLSLANMHNHCEQLYRFMSGHRDITFNDVERDSEEDQTASTKSTSWRPGTFTIAELIRAAKEANRPMLANDVIQWAVREGSFVPEGVVSDAVSFVYGNGRTDLALSMYRSLYSAGHVQHWHDKSSLTMDLHNFSRGMAFSAIKIAIDEAKLIARKSLNNELIVITGRSISRNKDKGSDDDDDGGYKLSSEIQRVLIEDFYPPIDSGTIPDNPGRLRIKL